jgi:hypothetical protein
MDFKSAITGVRSVRGGFPDDHHPQCMCPDACAPIKRAQAQLVVKAFGELIVASRARRASQQDPQRGVKRELDEEDNMQEPQNTRPRSFR